jgi:hypothetical protein
MSGRTARTPWCHACSTRISFRLSQLTVTLVEPHPSIFDGEGTTPRQRSRAMSSQSVSLRRKMTHNATELN